MVTEFLTKIFGNNNNRITITMTITDYGLYLIQINLEIFSSFFSVRPYIEKTVSLKAKFGHSPNSSLDVLSDCSLHQKCIKANRTRRRDITTAPSRRGEEAEKSRRQLGDKPARQFYIHSVDDRLHQGTTAIKPASWPIDISEEFTVVL